MMYRRFNLNKKIKNRKNVHYLKERLEKEEKKKFRNS